MFIQTFSTFVIQAEFYLNRSYIAENLCVNKDKPMMHCNGNCYLSKKLKAQQKQDQEAPVSKSQTFDVMPFFVPKLFIIEGTASHPKIHYYIKDESLVSYFHSSVFHPPAA